MAWLRALLAGNQLLQAILFPTALGAATFLLRVLCVQLHARLVRRFYSSVTLKSQDKNWDSVLRFLQTRCDIRSQNVLAETYRKKNRSWREKRMEWITGVKPRDKFEFRPNDHSAISFFKYKGNTIWMSRKQGDTTTIGWERKPFQLEEMTLSSWGADGSLLQDLLAEALDDVEEERGNEISVWILGSGWPGGWEKALTKPARSKDSVILDKDLADDLIADAKAFIDSAQWYTDRGIPYRRGYLLHGPPGTGKTSFTMVLASELKVDLCMLSLSNPDLNDNKLAESLRETPKNSIIMLEDVDAIFTNSSSPAAGDPDDSRGSNSKGVTFSGLLNAIDGVASQEGRILVMTTNHKDRLDPALKRPGRCDVHVNLRNASQDQARRIFLRFFPGCEALADKFQRRVPQHELSMAALQGHLLAHRDDPDRAVDTVQALLSPPPDGAGEKELPVYDYLKRLGLRKFAGALEAFGFSTKQALSGIKFDEIKALIVELRYDVKPAKRLRLLFEGDPATVRDHLIADMPVVKQLVTAAFPLAVAEGVEISDYQTMVLQFIDALCPSGKGRASTWEIRNYLSMYGDDFKAALADIDRILLRPRSDPESPAFMTALEWCRRAGLPGEIAHDLADNGIKWARDIVDLDDEDDAKEKGFGPHAERALRCIKAQTDEPSAHDLRSMAVVDWAWARDLFLGRWPDELVLARGFATKVTDPEGQGLLSLFQLRGHLEKNLDAAETCRCADYLFGPSVPRKKEEEEPEPEEAYWINRWLESHGLEEYASNFIDEDLKTKEDLLLAPISDADLKNSLDVETLGHRRTLLAKIKDLAEAPRCELETIEPINPTPAPLGFTPPLSP